MWLVCETCTTFTMQEPPILWFLMSLQTITKYTNYILSECSTHLRWCKKKSIIVAYTTVTISIMSYGVKQSTLRTTWCKNKKKLQYLFHVQGGVLKKYCIWKSSVLSGLIAVDDHTNHSAGDTNNNVDDVQGHSNLNWEHCPVVGPLRRLLCSLICSTCV